MKACRRVHWGLPAQDMLRESLAELGDALGNPSKLQLLCGTDGQGGGGVEQQVHAKLRAGLAYDSPAVQQQLRRVLKAKLGPRAGFVPTSPQNF